MSFQMAKGRRTRILIWNSNRLTRAWIVDNDFVEKRNSDDEIEELETDEDTKEESEEELIKINEQDSLDSELLNDDDLDIDFISLDDEFDTEIFVS